MACPENFDLHDEADPELEAELAMDFSRPDQLPRDVECVCYQCGRVFLYCYPAVVCGACDFNNACGDDPHGGEGG